MVIVRKTYEDMGYPMIWFVVSFLVHCVQCKGCRSAPVHCQVKHLRLSRKPETLLKLVEFSVAVGCIFWQASSGCFAECWQRVQGFQKPFQKFLVQHDLRIQFFSKQKVPKKAFRLSEFICNMPGSMHSLSSLVNVDQRWWKNWFRFIPCYKMYYCIHTFPGSVWRLRSYSVNSGSPCIRSHLYIL